MISGNIAINADLIGVV